MDDGRGAVEGRYESELARVRRQTAGAVSLSRARPRAGRNPRRHRAHSRPLSVPAAVGEPAARTYVCVVRAGVPEAERRMETSVAQDRERSRARGRHLELAQRYLSDGFFLPFDSISTVFARRASRV